MTNAKIQTPAQHNVRLIAVPEEKLNAFSPGVAAGDIETLTDTDTGREYDVIDYYDAYKEELTWPLGLITLAVGKPLTRDEIFRVYQNSEKVYLFIAKPKEETS